MPRKDPFTGCPVMTTAEFFTAEAEHEGKGRSGAEVMEETMADVAQVMDEENERVQAEWRDPAGALAILLPKVAEVQQEWDEELRWLQEDPNRAITIHFNHDREEYVQHIFEQTPRMLTPTEVIEVIEADHQQRLNGAQGHFTARCRVAERPVIVHYAFWFSQHHGSYMEPPDYDESVDWVLSEIG